MRKIIVLIGVLLLVALMTTVASAGDDSNVAYTWTVTELGQGFWGGGPLFADGSTGGNLAVSGRNGEVIFHLHPTSWTEVVPGEAVDICFTLHEIKGDSGLPPAFCGSAFGLVLPVTGTPVMIPNPISPDVRLLIRVTPAN